MEAESQAQPEMGQPPQAPRPKRARLSLSRSVALSFVLHLAAFFLAYGRPLLRMRGQEPERREVNVAVVWSPAPIPDDSEPEDLEEVVVEEPEVEIELVPTDVIGEDPSPELPQIEPLPLQDIAWSEHPLEFYKPKPVEPPAPALDVPPPSPAPPVEPTPPLPEAEPVGEEEAASAPSMLAELCKEPEYPLRAQQRRIEGSVLLLIRVSAEGRVLSVEIQESSGSAILDAAARKAVLDWRFTPALRAGVPIEGSLEHRIRFELADR